MIMYCYKAEEDTEFDAAVEALADLKTWLPTTCCIDIAVYCFLRNRMVPRKLKKC